MWGQRRGTRWFIYAGIKSKWGEETAQQKKRNEQQKGRERRESMWVHLRVLGELIQPEKGQVTEK